MIAHSTSRLASFLSSAGERVRFFVGEIGTTVVHINDRELVSSCFCKSFNTGKNPAMWDLPVIISSAQYASVLSWPFWVNELDLSMWNELYGSVPVFRFFLRLPMEFMGGERGKEGSWVLFLINPRPVGTWKKYLTDCVPGLDWPLAQTPQSLCVALWALATFGLHQIQPTVLKWLAREGTNGEAGRGPSSFVYWLQNISI